MANGSKVLHAMERLVSSLLQTESSENVVKTIDIGVSYTSPRGRVVTFPHWESSGAMVPRQVTFTGMHVSVTFPGEPGRLYNGRPQSFDGEFTLPTILELFKSCKQWNLVEVKLWEDKPYSLYYACTGDNPQVVRIIVLYDTARAESMEKAKEADRQDYEQYKRTHDATVDFGGSAPSFKGVRRATLTTIA